MEGGREGRREEGRARLFPDLGKLRGEFEWRALEAEVVPRRVGQHKAKVDVDDVSLRVHQDVAIVSAE